MPTSIASIRQDYSARSLSRKEVNQHPINQFKTWFEEARHAEIEEVNAMTLSTANKDGRPSGRIVLLKGVENKGFVFFTNYQSKKGLELAENPFASLTFFWKELERQVRIDGRVEKISEADSNTYFKSRPYKSRVGSWVSDQSKPLSSRVELMKKFTVQAAKFIGQEVPKPDFWGGYILIPDSIEFWQGRPSRLHDRIKYKLIDDSWNIERLSP
ncbi:Pyridoxamine 5'-phosphate oxidase [hydrothermal vent metagenome]|uniref:Pyridoxamine 5'-phosphate oxidase n=1 Tax=hydrothermal vent metagenome TaxID=652676 RepID=A0A3B1D2F5_9ZZZZ